MRGRGEGEEKERMVGGGEPEGTSPGDDGRLGEE